MTDAPEHLDGQARVKWDQVYPTLQERGGVSQGTLDALACYCQAWSRWTAAEQQVSTLGPVVKSPAGFAVANPFVAIAAAASRQMRQWGDALRLTPKSRGRVTKAVDEAEDADDADQGNSLLRLLGSGSTPASVPRTKTTAKTTAGKTPTAKPAKTRIA